MAGKMLPYIGTESYLSASELKCIDYSVLAYQYTYDANWGLELDYKPNEADTFILLLYANDTAPGYKDNNHPDAAKLMLGAEFITARRDGADCYNGWTYTCALLCNF